MNMPRVKLIILENGKHIWYPINYNYRNIKTVWIEEKLTKEEFIKYRNEHTLLKNFKNNSLQYK